MKKVSKVLLLVIFLITIITIFTYSSKKEIKTIKSERQLLSLYENNGYKSITLIEEIITLPFSVLRLNRYEPIYNTRSKYSSIDVAVNDSVETTGNSPTKNYSKTNIQVEGVDEADIIKTDGDYIYSLSGNSVVITNVQDKENIKISSTITSNAIPNDLIIFSDKLVIISASAQQNYYNQNTVVEIYNIKDKTAPKLLKSFELYEPYHTTRCIDGKLYIFSKGYLRVEDKQVQRDYKEDNKIKTISLNNIKYLKNNRSNMQTLIAEVDLNNIDDIKLNSYLIDISNAYVSKKHIYLLDDDYYNDKIKISSLFTYKGIIGFFKSVDNSYKEKTKIYKFNMTKNGISLQTTKQLTGRIVNQYSLDEKDNNLRIALQSDKGTRICILDNKLHLIGETESVAKGERMYASRFMDNMAYLVTFKNTDPLFVIDLSNAKKPQVMGELKIPGYSTYLHPYDETHLIGIGMDTEEIINRDSSGKVTSTWVRTKGMKMCLFDVSDINNPQEMFKTTIGDNRTASAILTNPKALLFSKEKSLLAIPVNNYKEDFEVQSSTSYEQDINNYSRFATNYISEGYFVYNINLDQGFSLKGVINHEKSANNYYYYYGKSKLLRGLYIENDLYTVSENSIKVNKLDDLSEISNLKINSKGESN